MRVHNKGQLVQGIAYLCLGVLYLIRGISEQDGFNITMGILWGILALIAICFSTDEERAARARESEREIRQAVEKRFGKWAWPIRLLGVGPAVLGLFLLIRMQYLLAACLLIFAGLIYTVAVEFWLKRWGKQHQSGRGESRNPHNE